MRVLALVLVAIAAVDKPIAAREIAEKYEENEVAADAAYKGKRLSLVGPVEKVWRADGAPVIDLETGLDAYESKRIVCYLRKGQPDAAVAGLRAGQKVTLSCVGDGRRMSIVMKDCELSAR